MARQKEQKAKLRGQNRERKERKTKKKSKNSRHLFTSGYHISLIESSEIFNWLTAGWQLG